MLNKKDLLVEEEFAERREKLLNDLNWQGPVFAISAISGEGTKELMFALMGHLEALRRNELSHEVREAEDAPWDPLQ